MRNEYCISLLKSAKTNLMLKCIIFFFFNTFFNLALICKNNSNHLWFNFPEKCKQCGAIKTILCLHKHLNKRLHYKYKLCLTLTDWIVNYPMCSLFLHQQNIHSVMLSVCTHSYDKNCCGRTVFQPYHVLWCDFLFLFFIFIALSKEYTLLFCDLVT